MQAQILHTLDAIATMYANAHKKKGARPMKVPPLNQPEYVEKAKKQTREQKREEAKMDQVDLAEIFEKRNSNVNRLEKK